MKLTRVKYFLMLLVALAMYSGCKKDETADEEDLQPPPNPYIFGNWVCDTAVQVQYDSSTSDYDTTGIALVDTSGNSVVYLERYLSPKQFYICEGTLSNTTLASTFSMSGNTLTINSPDNVLQSNDRIILTVNDTALTWKYVTAFTTPPVVAIFYMSQY